MTEQIFHRVRFLETRLYNLYGNASQRPVRLKSDTDRFVKTHAKSPTLYVGDMPQPSLSTWRELFHLENTYI